MNISRSMVLQILRLLNDALSYLLPFVAVLAFDPPFLLLTGSVDLTLAKIQSSALDEPY